MSVNAGNTYEGQTINLTDDIDLSGIDWLPIGTDESYFSGNFDGQGYTMSKDMI